jgi:glutathione-independent formaldehyde dehydrogenase
MRSQAHDTDGEEHSNMTLNMLVECVKPTGRIGVVGVFPSEDPKSKDKFEKQGQVVFDIGKFFEKELSMGSGQCNVKAYNRFHSMKRPKRTDTLMTATKDGPR